MDLQSIVQAVRGQHHGDFRPNKAMCPARLNQLLSGYSRSPRYGNIAVDSAMIHDLQWTQMILDNGRLQELPLAMYTEMQPIDVHLYMDASNQGLAVLNPAVRQYIQVQFDEEEKDMIRKATGPNGFNINVREQMCVALAAWTFGPSWVSTTTTSMVFIKAWSDNKPTIKHQPNDTRSKVLAANRLSEVIKNAAVALGSEPSRFGTHSMRSGGATAMFVAGVDRLMIKSGRWTSDAYERYTRMNDMVSRSLAQQMSRGARSRVSPV
ncbi:hypothetical protein PC119_g11615 [Phytophthora cactorum]|nr:hypothetical protein PC119_g11615 [Phytophthora cactorum]